MKLNECRSNIDVYVITYNDLSAIIYNQFRDHFIDLFYTKIYITNRNNTYCEIIYNIDDLIDLNKRNLYDTE